MRVLLAVLVAVVALAFVAVPTQAGGDGTIRAGDYTAEVGEEVIVVLQAVDISPPGLGAWAVDVIYDSAIVHAVACTSEQRGVCSPAFAHDTVRVTGAVVSEGLTGNFPLATFTFACDAVGTSELEVDEVLFTTAEPQLEIDDLTLDNGSITCTEPPDLITISSLDLEVGQEGLVFVEAERVAQPGVGAWRIELIYNFVIAPVTSCNALGERSFCSGDPQESAAQGFEADGLLSGTVLAEFSIRCRQPGEFTIGVSIGVWSVAGVGLDERPFELRAGRITCRAPQPEQLPVTGGAGPQPASTPATVPLAVLGAVLLSAALAFRRYALR